jgi:hypothetical protein
MEIEDSKESKYWQQTFSVSVELAGEYLVNLAIVEIPLLGLPVVKQIFSYIVKKIVARSENEGELWIAFKFIDKESKEKNEQYKDAIKDLEEVLASNPTEEKKNEALEETKKRLRNLIRFPVK